MVSKTDIGIVAVLIAGVVLFRNQIAGAVGQAGGVLGSALGTGFQDFFSGLQGAFTNKPALGMTPDTGTADIPKTMDMMMPKMPPDATGEAKTTEPSPRTGATDITPQTLSDYFSMLTMKFPKAVEDIPSIGGDLLKYLQQGGTDILDFAKSYKFPSGMTLDEILGAAGKGGGKSIIPDASAMQQTGTDYLSIITSYERRILQLQGGNPSEVHTPDLTQAEAMRLIPQYENIITMLLSRRMSPEMAMMANLNIDHKIDTEYGKFSYGSAMGSIGAGAGSILPPHTLTQVLQQHPEFSASQAADFLARTMMNYGNFDFGTNTGGGRISTFTDPTKDMPIPRVITSEVNPVLRAYEEYKAMYGLM